MEPYVYHGREAALHLFRVAVGRESLVVGERQISGQFFGALEARPNPRNLLTYPQRPGVHRRHGW